jgi:Fe2+ transport system protein FeoA
MFERRLSDVAPGETVGFVGYDATVDASVRDRLLAYGIAPARRLDVLQQRPLTIVVCDHAELALEASVARSMRVVGD